MNFVYIFCLLVPLILSIVLHEVAHGYVAWKLGDPTARDRGRLSLNPLKHVSWVGTILVPGILLLTHSPFLFAWAKPVPVDARYFRSPRKGMGLVAIAGPVVNLVLAAFFAVLLRFSPDSGMAGSIFQAGVIVNLVLCVFNLIPIPPLDGSRVLSALLPTALATVYARLERVGLFIVMLLLGLGALRFMVIPIAWLYRALTGADF